MPDTLHVYESAVKQLAGHEDRLAKLRHGLREMKIEAAAQSLADANDNTARAAFARIEGMIEHLLTIAGLLLIGLLATSPAASAAAPDPVATNAVQLVGFDGNNFRYAITVAASTAVDASAAPDCHGAVTITLCGRHVSSVTGLPAIWDTNGVRITGAPVGTSYVTVKTDQPMNANQVAWTLTVDDGRRYTGTTEGPTCGPNAVALVGFGAAGEDVGRTLRLVVILIMFGAAVILVGGLL